MMMVQSSTPSGLTPKHVRAARALLAWSQQDLAKAAKVGTSTVADFERGSRTPVANNAQAIRSALETAGIRFLPTGAVIGPPVSMFTSSDRSGTPVRWVDADDLASWAGRTDGPFSLPTLLAFLIRATHGSAIHLRFPSDGGVRHSGWDGLTVTDVGSDYVPQGNAGWELSAQRTNISQKITKDYTKRTTEPAPLDPAVSAYIFVTLHHWPQKDEWARTQTSAGPWREVRVYDADDLVHWIEQTPAVGLWLANRLGKRPPETRELDEVWTEWSRATQWPLTEDLVLSDRDQDVVEVLRWLRNEPSVLSLRATTSDEVVSFFHATLSELPDNLALAYRARCLVVTTAAAARALADAPAPLILVLTEPEPGLAQSLASKGHFVLQAYDDRYTSRGEARTLERPSREGIANALRAGGIAEPRARALARDSARNLAVLRRLLPGAPGRLPKWAEGPPPRALLAALLAGGWDDNSEADQALLSKLADTSYEQTIATLTPYVDQFDSPLQKVGTTWRVASPSDAWFLLAHHLTTFDIKRFEEAAHSVFGSIDPRFAMDPNERWMAAIKGVHRDYSDMIRHGIGQVLILLALWGSRVHTVPDVKHRADAIVRKLLTNADQRLWWSLSRDFRLLAEASPNAFLSAIEDCLDQDNTPILSLFAHDEGNPFGVDYLSNLMWAMESLAWSPDFLPRVSLNLARLDALDTKPRHHSNGPANSLRQIHLLWSPQTYATLDRRLRALDLIRKQEPNAAWKLMLGLLPSGHDMSMPSPLPRWRDFSVDKIETVTWPLIRSGATAISQRLLEDVGTSAARWISLLGRIGNLGTGPEAVLDALERAEPLITAQADRHVIWNKLRSILHHHRQFPEAEWRLPDPVLDHIDVIYNRFEPTDPLERIAWLFQDGVQVPNPSAEGWEASQRDVEVARIEAARILFEKNGITSVLALARLTERAVYLGKAIYDADFPDSDIDALIEAAVRSDNSRERDVAHGLIVSTFCNRGEDWGANLLNKARSQAWGDTAVITILHAFPITRWTWDQVAAIGGETETIYWRQTPVFWMNDDQESVAYAIRHLIDAGRARHALPLTQRGADIGLPTELLVELLQEAGRQPFEGNGDKNEATMFQHYVTEALGVLDKRKDVDHNVLVMLEWNYLQLLEHSHRPAKVLLRALSEQPPLFIEMLKAVFRPSEESGIIDPEPANFEQARAVANQAYRLLSIWDRLPGTRDDGIIDGHVLESWIKEARILAQGVGRRDIANDRIGQMLSASPIGADGNWPAEPVRDALDLFRSKPMLEGFQVGKSNRRGVTTRMPRDGGEQERALAAQYRTWAEAISLEHPYTAKALNGLAERYDWQAQRHDEDAERLDWES
ncbi:helix-turn-helix domain-containing protein [Gluconacetobacter entanii]|uniref:helix-turn-helix domain-containing protein n=1 Tax=Gluconacetobacter entanii TaxID=108528 RepID=UPI001C9346F5|nr:helix-turn-helix transcriptional regulator [Gluconacetobacter entanii]MBY4640512.1 helix-turn-helix domain-containing protein [Gluconacetobacter entanii]MCW4579111.1 helix-turn-helix domain-containing protein [Gluconacetobacter entanii]MCW4582516.1 helix-turn-helix domain-containing protein [Gluconacetobacter entanii]MCW4585885.1 helix-turn-helix domain-containing protein [Gluconacetobacter entanii]